MRKKNSNAGSETRRALLEAQAQVRLQGSQLQAILDNVYDGISVFDRSGAHVYRNDESARIYGFEDADAAARAERQDRDRLVNALAVASFPDGRSLSPEEWPPSRVLAGQRIKNELYTIKRRDLGLEKIVDISGAPIRDADDKVVFAVLATHDITTQKKREEADKLLVQRMERARLESLSVLAGGVAHDFNNLLMAILGNADLALLNLSKSSPVVKNLNNIRATTWRAADLCTQMLAYSGQGRKEETAFSLSQLIDQNRAPLNSSISKNCILKFALEPDVPMMKGDPSQMRQVVTNLVINASDAIGDRSGTIKISTAAVNCTQENLSNGYVITPLRPGLYVSLMVSDNGPGIDKEMIGRIFEPFFTTRFTGRGLGLSAVQGIIRSHGGGLNIQSEPEKGTVFTVLMPAIAPMSGEPRG